MRLSLSSPRQRSLLSLARTLSHLNPSLPCSTLTRTLSHHRPYISGPFLSVSLHLPPPYHSLHAPFQLGRIKALGGLAQSDIFEGRYVAVCRSEFGDSSQGHGGLERGPGCGDAQGGRRVHEEELAQRLHVPAQMLSSIHERVRREVGFVD